jgi:hypothetical protein
MFFNKEHSMQKVVFNTCGDGLWSTAQKAVEIVDMQLNYVDEEKEFGELVVIFNTDTWDCEKDGLIYTDGEFLDELQDFLIKHNLAGADVSYSEQGMQEFNYVSLDVGEEFIASWVAKFGEQSIAHLLD